MSEDPAQLKIDGEVPVKAEEPKAPHRVQYTRGLKLPNDTIYVGRPSPYGNPYKMASEADRDRVIALYRAHIRARLKRQPMFLEALRGKNLACWCELEKKCHADVLLEMLK